MPSNFENSSLFNELIGNQRGDRHDIDWAGLEQQFQLIREEFDELCTAIATRDIVELRDGGADLLETTYGLFYRAGYDADDDYNTVFNSNMSKFCSTLEEANETIEMYEGWGIRATIRPKGGYYAVISADDQTDIDGKFFPKGKLLKSINFTSPVFG